MKLKVDLPMPSFNLLDEIMQEGFRKYLAQKEEILRIATIKTLRRYFDEDIDENIESMELVKFMMSHGYRIEAMEGFEKEVPATMKEVPNRNFIKSASFAATVEWKINWNRIIMVHDNYEACTYSGIKMLHQDIFNNVKNLERYIREE